MRKTDKKLDNQLQSALTRVCEAALSQVEGFQWLTHVVNFQNYPASLKVVCVFDNDDSMIQYLQSVHKQRLAELIEQELAAIKVNLKQPSKHILYDSKKLVMKNTTAIGRSA